VHEGIHVVDGIEHGNVAAPAIGVSTRWVQEGDDVTDPLAC
jgi:hypothetical protein